MARKKRSSNFNPNSIKLYKDYYSVLGLSKGSNPSANELKSIYTKLSLKYHPDKAPSGKQNDVLFTALKEAYDVIIDQQSKSYYDSYRPSSISNYHTSLLLQEFAKMDSRSPIKVLPTNIERYLNNGASLDQALIAAQKKLMFNLVVLFIGCGANPSFITASYIISALAEGHTEILDILAIYGTNLNHIRTPNGENIMSHAYNQNDQSTINLLIKAGIKPYFTNLAKNAVIILDPKGRSSDKVFVIPNVKIKATDNTFSLLKNNPTALKALFDAGENPDVADPATGSTALMVAANHKLLDLVDLLLKKGANVSAVNAQGKTALYFAYKNNDYTTMKTLLKAGAKPFFIDPEGKAVIILNSDGQLLHKIPVTGETKATDSIFALLKNNPTALKALFDAGENQDVADPATRSTALMVAVNHKLPDLVDLLLKKGAKADSVNAQGKTALHFAYKNNDYTTIKTLLKAGAKPFFIDPEGKAVIILNSDGQLLHKIPVTGETKATDSIFALLKNNPTALKALFDAGENQDVADPATRSTALMVAVNHKLPDLVDLLLKKGANVSTVNAQGKTALHFAYKNNDLKSMKALLGNGAKPFFIDPEGKAVVILNSDGQLLHKIPVTGEIKATDSIFALLKNNPTALKALFDAGESPDVTDPATRSTALMVAADHKLPDLVKSLLKKGVEVNKKNAQGKTALDYAQKDATIEKILLAVGADTKYAKKSPNVKLFEADPRKFILKHNTQVDLAKLGFNNLHLDDQQSARIKEQTIECLDTLDLDKSYDNGLAGLCGKGGTYYLHND